MEGDEKGLLRLALDWMPAGVTVADAEDHIIAMNEQAKRMVGQDGSCRPFPSLSGHAPCPDDVDRGMKDMRAGITAEFAVMQEDPATGRVYRHRYSAMRSQDGTFVGTVVISRDAAPRSREQAPGEPEELRERFADGMITLVNALEARDRYTCGHSSRVARIAGAVSRKVLPRTADSMEVELAARLHDIGKVVVPDRLLDKPSSLTPAEILLMDTHPLVGERILQPIVELRTVASIIRSHHERWDGKGYPDGLSGDGIPVGSRVLALADTFDAMTSQRPYREAIPVAGAQEEIATQLGRQFDPGIGETFLAMIRSGEIEPARQDGPS